MEHMEKLEEACRYEAVLFDLDGTLTQSHPGILECVKRGLVEMGKPVPPPEILRKFIGPLWPIALPPSVA